MEKRNITGYTLNQLEQALTDLAEKPFRGRQIFKWLYNRRLMDFENMTDLSSELRVKLAERFTIGRPKVELAQKSSDGTEKFLFKLHDNLPVESVLIPDGDRRTICISSQAGCALGCRFCATGGMGLHRDLTTGEILGQLMALRDLYGENSFSNVVFMGMGEPLQNYDNLVAAITIMTDQLGLKISPRKITVSTSGVTPKIKMLADSGLKTQLALSLHAAIDAKRKRIMPVAETFSLDKLMAAVRYYARTTGQRVTIEYILFDGFNDKLEDIKALTRLLHELPCKINILAYNPVEGLPFARPSESKIDWFARQLYPKLQAVTVRKSRGLDIEAACGQLAGKSLKKEKM